MENKKNEKKGAFLLNLSEVNFNDGTSNTEFFG